MAQPGGGPVGRWLSQRTSHGRSPHVAGRPRPTEGRRLLETRRRPRAGDKEVARRFRLPELSPPGISLPTSSGSHRPRARVPGLAEEKRDVSTPTAGPRRQAPDGRGTSRRPTAPMKGADRRDGKRLRGCPPPTRSSAADRPAPFTRHHGASLRSATGGYARTRAGGLHPDRNPRGGNPGEGRDDVQQEPLPMWRRGTATLLALARRTTTSPPEATREEAPPARPPTGRGRIRPLGTGPPPARPVAGRHRSRDHGTRRLSEPRSTLRTCNPRCLSPHSKRAPSPLRAGRRHATPGRPRRDPGRAPVGPGAVGRGRLVQPGASSPLRSAGRPGTTPRAVDPAPSETGPSRPRPASPGPLPVRGA